MGRVLPRIHSPLATPTNNPESVLHMQTPEETVVVRVPFLQFNDFFLRVGRQNLIQGETNHDDFNSFQYFRQECDMFAYDPLNQAKEGDAILMERMSHPVRKHVDFQLKQVIHRLGDVVDPLTGKPVIGHRFREDIDAIDEVYGRNKKGFRYEKAPPRGRLEGTKDFTDKVTYYKWHVFDKEDDYSLVS